MSNAAALPANEERSDDVEDAPTDDEVPTDEASTTSAGTHAGAAALAPPPAAPPEMQPSRNARGKARVKPSDAAAADDATTALLMMPPPDHDENSGGGVDFDASGNSQKPWRMTYLGQYGPIIECHRTREEAVQAYMGFKIAEQHAGDAPQYDVVVRREEMRRRTSPNDLASSAHSQERRQVVQREDKIRTSPNGHAGGSPLCDPTERLRVVQWEESCRTSSSAADSPQPSGSSRIAAGNGKARPRSAQKQGFSGYYMRAGKRARTASIHIFRNDKDCLTASTVDELLGALNLIWYAPTFHEMGFDDLEYLTSLTITHNLTEGLLQVTRVTRMSAEDSQVFMLGMVARALGISIHM